jgi:uncharacterized protein DUF732
VKKRTGWIVAGATVVGLAGLGTLLPDQQPDSGQAPQGTRVFIKVVQEQYPNMSGAEAVYLGGVACDALDRDGTTRFGATREVAAEDGQTARARYVTEAAIANLCPEYQDRQ